MKNKKFNLVSMSDKEIDKQQLTDIKGGLMIFPCACFRQQMADVRVQGVRRAN